MFHACLRMVMYYKDIMVSVYYNVLG